ncbi:unnamed protein product [Calicophoron daubneyi]|uniref:SUN domain-containing protein n=1 Tax=Calicophoron daubneyi TaxID=300641 RepID=A0AAV2TAQ8_CALDB
MRAGVLFCVLLSLEFRTIDHGECAGSKPLAKLNGKVEPPSVELQRIKRNEAVAAQHPPADSSLRSSDRIKDQQINQNTLSPDVARSPLPPKQAEHSKKEPNEQIQSSPPTANNKPTRPPAKESAPSEAIQNPELSVRNSQRVSGPDPVNSDSTLSLPPLEDATAGGIEQHQIPTFNEFHAMVSEEKEKEVSGEVNHRAKQPDENSQTRRETQSTSSDPGETEAHPNDSSAPPGTDKSNTVLFNDQMSVGLNANQPSGNRNLHTNPDTVSENSLPGSAGASAKVSVDLNDKTKADPNTVSPHQTRGDFEISRGESALPSESHVTLRRNVADVACGAKLLESSKAIKNADAVLNNNNDEYLNVPCSADKWFVAETCEPVQLRIIELANYELFSSRVKTFKVYVSDRYPAKMWEVAGVFTALDVKGLQTFEVKSDKLIKYVRFEMIEHYGSEHYCPLTMVRLFGRVSEDLADEEEENLIIHSTRISSPVEEPSSETVLDQSPPLAPDESLSATNNIIQNEHSLGVGESELRRTLDVPTQSDTHSIVGKQSTPEPKKQVSDETPPHNHLGSPVKSGRQDNSVSAIDTDGIIRQVAQEEETSPGEKKAGAEEPSSRVASEILLRRRPEPHRMHHPPPLRNPPGLNVRKQPRAELDGEEVKKGDTQFDEASTTELPTATSTPRVAVTLPTIVNPRPDGESSYATIFSRFKGYLTNIFFNSISAYLSPEPDVERRDYNLSAYTLCPRHLMAMDALIHYNVFTTFERVEFPLSPMVRKGLMNLRNCLSRLDALVVRSANSRLLLLSKLNYTLDTCRLAYKLLPSLRFSEDESDIETVLDADEDTFKPAYSIIQLLVAYQYRGVGSSRRPCVTTNPAIAKQSCHGISLWFESFLKNKLVDSKYQCPRLPEFLTPPMDTPSGGSVGSSPFASPPPARKDAVTNRTVSFERPRTQQNVNIPTGRIREEIVVPGGLAGSRKDTLFMRLNNRVRLIERNVSVSMRYLEELSQSYRRQMERLSRSFNLTTAWLKATAQGAEDRDRLQQARISQLEMRLDELLLRLKLRHVGNDSDKGVQLSEANSSSKTVAPMPVDVPLPPPPPAFEASIDWGPAASTELPWMQSVYDWTDEDSFVETEDDYVHDQTGSRGLGENQFTGALQLRPSLKDQSLSHLGCHSETCVEAETWIHWLQHWFPSHFFLDPIYSSRVWLSSLVPPISSVLWTVYMATTHLMFAVVSHLLIYWAWLRPQSRKLSQSYVPLALFPSPPLTCRLNHVDKKGVNEDPASIEPEELRDFDTIIATSKRTFQLNQHKLENHTDFVLSDVVDSTPHSSVRDPSVKLSTSSHKITSQCSSLPSPKPQPLSDFLQPKVKVSSSSACLLNYKPFGSRSINQGGKTSTHIRHEFSAATVADSPVIHSMGSSVPQTSNHHQPGHATGDWEGVSPLSDFISSSSPPEEHTERSLPLSTLSTATRDTKSGSNHFSVTTIDSTPERKSRISEVDHEQLVYTIGQAETMENGGFTHPSANSSIFCKFVKSKNSRRRRNRREKSKKTE